MKRIPVFIVCLAINISFATGAFGFGYPTAKVTAKVTDEQGESVSGADVSISFMKAKKGGWGMTTYNKDGKSDKDGLFSTSGEGTKSVSIFVKKSGYYPSGEGVELTSSSKPLNRWEPWNPTVEMVLKKKRNTVPMYDNHRTSYKVPKLNTPIGFDLEIEDWVGPYGKGSVSDFIITFNAEIRAYTDYDCGFTLTFTNPHDGIQEYFFDENDQSYFKWPFKAPENGYLAEVSKQKSMLLKVGYKSNEKKNVNYIFRIRSKVDRDGNIVEAKYGKLVGEFGFVPKGKVTFRYMFNPDGTRNLEEDPDRNLFKKK